MAKENKKIMNSAGEFKLPGNSRLVDVTTKALTKKGKLKGATKKETKMLKCVCTHHIRNKRGRIKPMIDVEGDMCKCSMCKGIFEGKHHTKEEIKDRISPVMDLTNQMIYLNQARSFGQESERFLARFKYELMTFEKLSVRITKASAKISKEKKGKPKKNKNYGSRAFDAWRMNR